MPLQPTSARELSETLAFAASAGKRICLGGSFSKAAMAGPTRPADLYISTTGIAKILQYEPADLVLSVEAGATWEKVSAVLAENHQMIPLDPPFGELATVGGVIASNGSGPRRRLYGSARDLVIGMQFVTLDGKLVQTGGMVVKNVAGLDMGKLMIGSFGTLAAISVVNFKLTPKPEVEKTALLRLGDLDGAMEARDRLIRGVLQPSAVDLLNPAAGGGSYILAVQFGGNEQVVARYAREVGGEILEGGQQAGFWEGVIGYSRKFLRHYPAGVVVRVSSTLKGIRDVLGSTSAPVMARAATGVSFLYFEGSQAAGAWMEANRSKPWRSVMEFSPEAEKEKLELWPAPGDDFETMKKVKHMFDPGNLLNHGRLYGRI